MDHDGPSSGRRKGRFVPKPPPPSRRPKTAVPKSESGDEQEGLAQAHNLLQRFTENQTRRKPKVEKKSSAQIAFGPGSPPSTLLKTYGTQKSGTSGRSTNSRRSSPCDDDEQIIDSLPSISKEVRTDKCASDDAIEASPSKIKSDYIESWDYNHSYYPTTLPLRKPHSGDPEVLDAEEFADANRKEYDEKSINPASDLGLLGEDVKRKMFFFQLPSNLPIGKQVARAKGKEKVENSISCGALNRNCLLEELPGGHLGKMLVYKSGAVKLKLGETLYDVSPGSECEFAQETAVINTKEKHYCVIGDVGKRAIVTPDINSILDQC